MKAAAYFGTKNIYREMIPSINSLAANSNVEKIYVFIEDDEFRVWMHMAGEGNLKSCVNSFRDVFHAIV